MSGTRYRADIDGLRAVAVLSVVLFHASADWSPGGYVGVDVFFVISGFLITGNIDATMRGGSFSLGTFYERRARRILPALAAVLLVSSLAAYRLLLPSEMAAYGQSLLACALSGANVFFWRDSGYFAPPAEGKPLLHTWSLGVEEQFYFLLPLLLAILLPLSRRHALAMVALLAVGSFVLSAAALDSHRVATFYLLPTRAWELLVGSLLALGVVPQVRGRAMAEAAAAAGLAGMLFAVFSYGPRTPFPGAAALAPCLGAAAVIHANAETQTLTGRLLASRPAVAVGLISYSLYLWHWPMLVYVRKWAIRPLTGWETIGLLAGAVAVSWLSWRYVEQPFRRPRTSGRADPAPVLRRSVVLIASFSLLGLALWKSGGLAGRMPQASREALKQLRAPGFADQRTCPEYTVESMHERGPCMLGGKPDEALTLFWGDSHLAPLVGSLAEIAAARGWPLAVAWTSGCTPALGIARTDPGIKSCKDENDAVAGWVREHNVREIILVGRWAAITEQESYGQETSLLPELEDASGDTRREDLLRVGLERIVTIAAERGLRVVIVGPIPEIGMNVPKTTARTLWWGRDFELRPTVSAYASRQRRVLATLRHLEADWNVRVLLPQAWFCDAEHCQVENQGVPLYSDAHHLSEAGGRLVVETLLADESLWSGRPWGVPTVLTD